MCVSFSCFLHNILHGNLALLFLLSNRKLLLLAMIALDLPKVGIIGSFVSIGESEMWNLFWEARWNHKSKYWKVTKGISVKAGLLGPTNVWTFKLLKLFSWKHWKNNKKQRVMVERHSFPLSALYFNLVMIIEEVFIYLIRIELSFLKNTDSANWQCLVANCLFTGKTIKLLYIVLS